MAPHPFYTRGFILHQEADVPGLIRRAYQHGNAARCLVVKGRRDYIADREQVLASVAAPAFDAMEAIGGTGDTLTGILAVLCGGGLEPAAAALLAASANRWTGFYAHPTPATQVFQLIDTIPRALQKALDGGLTEAERGANS
jgi:NAD(P)H-hydrate repair Nnr-like enzyme with NAD(P)H-hydrate dehydratase domain